MVTTGASSASPPQNICRSAVHAAKPGSASSARSSDGTTCMTVTRCACICRTSAEGSRWLPGSASTMQAPQNSGASSSHTEASAEMPVFCSTRSDASKPKVASIQYMWLQMAACSIITPLGWPVEPEV